jgi:hypothetical protein
MYAYIYDIATTYIEAHESTINILQDVTEVEDFEHMAKIFAETDIQMQSCKEFVDNVINSTFSEIGTDIETKKAAYSILMYQLKELKDNFTYGILDEKDFKNMEHIVITAINGLEINAPSGSIPTFSQILRTQRFFDDFPKFRVTELA